MHPNVSAALVAAVVAAGTALLVMSMGPAPKPRIVHVATSASQTMVARLAADQWAEIEQSEVDALTAALKSVPKDARSEVTIFCASDTRCGDLSLNLENSFESAGWKVTRKLVPLPDAYAGVLVNSDAMRSVLASATSLKPSKIDEETAGGGIGIIIGTKPKT